MGRPKRIEFPGAFYHVMSHGNGRQWLYRDAEQIDAFVSCLRELRKKNGVLVHAAVLMRTHYHLLLETPRGNLSSAMCRFNSEFVRLLNLRWLRSGHILRGRYKAILIEEEGYYSVLLRYVWQNPVRAGLVGRCEDYPGSSLAWMADKRMDGVIDWQDLRVSFVGSPGWPRRLVSFANNLVEQSPYADRESVRFLGSPEWIAAVKQKSGVSLKAVVDMPARQDFKRDSSGLLAFESRMVQALKRMDPGSRDEAGLLLRFSLGGQSIEEIRRSVGFRSYYAAAQRLCRFRKKLENNMHLKQQFGLACEYLQGGE